MNPISGPMRSITTDCLSGDSASSPGASELFWTQSVEISRLGPSPREKSRQLSYAPGFVVWSTKAVSSGNGPGLPSSSASVNCDRGRSRRGGSALVGDFYGRARVTGRLAECHRKTHCETVGVRGPGRSPEARLERVNEVLIIDAVHESESCDMLHGS